MAFTGYNDKVQKVRRQSEYRDISGMEKMNYRMEREREKKRQTKWDIFEIKKLLFRKRHTSTPVRELGVTKVCIHMKI